MTSASKNSNSYFAVNDRGSLSHLLSGLNIHGLAFQAKYSQHPEAFGAPETEIEEHDDQGRRRERISLFPIVFLVGNPPRVDGLLDILYLLYRANARVGLVGLPTTLNKPLNHYSTNTLSGGADYRKI